MGSSNQKETKPAKDIKKETVKKEEQKDVQQN